MVKALRLGNIKVIHLFPNSLNKEMLETMLEVYETIKTGFQENFIITSYLDAE
jgi:hypothetical protein